MKHRSMAIAAGIALLSTGVLASAAEAATTSVRQADFIPALSDTRTTGHLDFLREGVHLWTEGSTSTDKVAEYFAPQGAPASLPGSVSYEWFGTANQPGAQIVFTATGSAGNATGTNRLVGEQVYSTNPAGGNLTDWWYPGGTARAATNSITCPSTTGGSGSDCHGTLAEWKASNPTAAPAAYGFSLGSGVQGDGVLRSLTYDGTVYEFTDTAAIPSTPTPVVVKKDVTGDVARKGHSAAKLRLVFKADAMPTGFTEGKALTWKVKFDGKTTVKLTQGAGDVDKYFVGVHDGAKHVVTVLKNGVKVATYKLQG